MLRINRLRIEIKTANEENEGIYGFDEKEGLMMVPASF